MQDYKKAIPSQWWRWPLLPVVAIGGGIGGAYILRVLGSISLSLGGFKPDGWMQTYVLAAMVAGVFGFLLLKISYAMAPTQKIKTSKIVAWLLLAFNLLNVIFAWVFSVEAKTGLVIGSCAASVGAFAALLEIKSQAK